MIVRLALRRSAAWQNVCGQERRRSSAQRGAIAMIATRDYQTVRSACQSAGAAVLCSLIK